MNDHARQPESVHTEHIRHSDSDIESLREDMKEVKEAVMAMKDMLILFENTKGFIITVKWIGLAVLGVAAVGGVVAGALAAFKAWAKS